MTDDWPFWFVADERGINVTLDVYARCIDPNVSRSSMPFMPRDVAERLAMAANGQA